MVTSHPVAPAPIGVVRPPRSSRLFVAAQPLEALLEELLLEELLLEELLLEELLLKELLAAPTLLLPSAELLLEVPSELLLLLEVPSELPLLVDALPPSVPPSSPTELLLLELLVPVLPAHSGTVEPPPARQHTPSPGI